MAKLNAQDKLAKAEQDLVEKQRDLFRARNSVFAAKDRIDQCFTNLKKSMPVSNDFPCMVAILPTGKLAVHVSDGRGGSVIHLCLPSFFNEDGTGRTALNDEKLGERWVCYPNRKTKGDEGSIALQEAIEKLDRLCDTKSKNCKTDQCFSQGKIVIEEARKFLK